MVVLGPFNRHIMTSENQKEYLNLRNRILGFLESRSISVVNPEILPSRLYGDASHPLTEGYALLAERLAKHSVFTSWLNR